MRARGNTPGIVRIIRPFFIDIRLLFRKYFDYNLFIYLISRQITTNRTHSNLSPVISSFRCSINIVDPGAFRLVLFGSFQNNIFITIKKNSIDHAIPTERRMEHSPSMILIKLTDTNLEKDIKVSSL